MAQSFGAATNFPTTPGAFQTTAGSPGDAFVTKLGPTGSTLVYSTYLGGSGNSDQALGIALDSAGNACVTGFTNSPNFPTTPSAFQTSFAGGGFDAFVTKVNAAGSALVYSTYLGGRGDEQARGIAVDSASNIYVTGNTNSSNFPTTAGAFQTALTGVLTSFVAKFNPAASGAASLVYSTYLGGGSGQGIAVDSGGSAYVTGFASSTGFATTPGPFQTTLPAGANPGLSHNFVTSLNAAGSALVLRRS